MKIEESLSISLFLRGIKTLDRYFKSEIFSKISGDITLPDSRLGREYLIWGKLRLKLIELWESSLDLKKYKNFLTDFPAEPLTENYNPPFNQITDYMGSGSYSLKESLRKFENESTDIVKVKLFQQIMMEIQEVELALEEKEKKSNFRAYESYKKGRAKIITLSSGAMVYRNIIYVPSKDLIYSAENPDTYKSLRVKGREAKLKKCGIQVIDLFTKGGTFDPEHKLKRNLFEFLRPIIDQDIYADSEKDYFVRDGKKICFKIMS